jgi:hypothetical protein
MDRIAPHAASWRRSLAHGDFTATNTFFADGQLYVFDWEYASEDHAPGYELLHFVLSAPHSRRKGPAAALQLARASLADSMGTTARAAEDALLLAYLSSHALAFAAREPASSSILSTWSREPESAVLLDAILQRNR